MEDKHAAAQRRADVTWSETLVTPAMRAASKGQRGVCLWFTGLSGSGKSTLANALELALHERGRHTMLLDGDNVRHGLCRDLDMSVTDRSENIRRVAEVARLMVDAGLIVVTAFISPIARDRAAARSLFAADEFIEIFVDTPLSVCEARDPKGLYLKARQGLIKDFTGLDSPYERPQQPELIVDTEADSVECILERILAFAFDGAQPRVPSRDPV